MKYAVGDRVRVPSDEDERESVGLVGTIATAVTKEWLNEPVYYVDIPGRGTFDFYEDELAPAGVKVIEGVCKWEERYDSCSIGGEFIDNLLQNFDGKRIRITIEEVPDDAG
jgi:hypothetical protein